MFLNFFVKKFTFYKIFLLNFLFFTKKFTKFFIIFKKFNRKKCFFVKKIDH